MAQADSNSNIPVTADPTRRSFLSATASAAAGGAVLAMAAIPPMSAAAAPVGALASGEPDPVLALIEAHRAATTAHFEACVEKSRREQALIDEGIGLHPFAVMVSNGSPIVAHTHRHIDALVDIVGEQVAKQAHAGLDAALERYRAVYGGIGNEACEAGDIASQALDNLVTTVPTSVHGIRAVLSYLMEDVADFGEQFGDEYKMRILLCSMR
jgi:hypothetical protein